MKVLVIGANGQIGKKVVSKLKKTHHQPVAMVRKKSQAADFENIGSEVVLADLEDNFEHAFKGINGVVFTAGSGGHTGKDKTHLVDRLGAKKAIDLSVKHNIDHFVMVSAFRADLSPDEWPDSMKHYFEAKADADKHLKQTELNYTILKPGRLTNDEGSGNVQLAEKTPDRGGTIPRDDVATVIEKVIGKQNTFKKSLELLSGDTPIEQAVENI